MTMPLKRDVLPLLDAVDETARLAGAANTLLLEDDGAGGTRRRGANTDVAGIVRAFAAAGVERSQRAVVLGAGSTARSALVALARIGAGHVTVAARRPAQVRELSPSGTSSGSRWRRRRWTTRRPRSGRRTPWSARCPATPPRPRRCRPACPRRPCSST
ncbi:shikimate dehydrogenase family protein [Clavibacter tessellarius]|uniref:shikimate dehydrogenase family protein n=1 Tax=Clavibacter tessellarius TaxID=31965 RepID=UPI003255ED02